MRPTLCWAIALQLLSTASLASQQPATDTAGAYHALLARLKARDTSIDFTALRLAYAHSPEYSPYGSDADDLRDSMMAALQRRDYRRAVQQADSALTFDYLDIRTHVMRAFAAEQAGDSAAATWDRVVASLLTRSITRSGSGNADSPYVVVSVAEEYAVLGMTGYDRGRQSLGKCGKRPCDVLETTNHETGQPRTFYFDISLPMGHLDHLFDNKH